jgi:hypothetical protein
MEGISPSGEPFATARQVQYLEEMITKQQAKIDYLEGERDFFKRDFQKYLSEQVSIAEKQRGSKGIDVLTFTKYTNSLIGNAITILQEKNMEFLESNFSNKKLQELERKLIMKPAANTDIMDLVYRVSQLEKRVHDENRIVSECEGFTTAAINKTTPTTNTATTALSEEITNLKEHITHLETNLIKEVQRAYTTTYKPGDYGTPLAKLQNQVNMLQQDVNTLKVVDTQQYIDNVIGKLTTNFKNDFESRVQQYVTNTRVDELILSQERVNNFCRDIQQGFIKARREKEDFQREFVQLFSEERWGHVVQDITEKTKYAFNEQLREMKGTLQLTRDECAVCLKDVERVVYNLDKEVRGQYGPEILGEQIMRIKKSLEERQTAFEIEIESQFSGRMQRTEAEVYGLRQKWLEFSSSVKKDIQATELTKKYEFFENALAQQNTKFASLDRHYSEHLKEIEKQNVTMETYMRNVEGYIDTIRKNVDILQVEWRREGDKMKDRMSKMIEEKASILQSRCESIEKYVSGLTLQLQTAEELLGTAVEQRKATEASMQKDFTNFEKRLQEKIDVWKEEKMNDIITRMTEISGKVSRGIVELKEQQERIDDFISDTSMDTISARIEKRVKQVQEDWNARRVQEFGARFSEFSKELDVMRKSLYDEHDRYKATVTKVETLLSDKTLRDFVNAIEKKMRNVHEEWVEYERNARNIEFARIDTQLQITEEGILKEQKKTAEIFESLEKALRKTQNEQNAKVLQETRYHIKEEIAKHAMEIKRIEGTFDTFLEKTRIEMDEKYNKVFMEQELNIRFSDLYEKVYSIINKYSTQNTNFTKEQRERIDTIRTELGTIIKKEKVVSDSLESLDKANIILNKKIQDIVSTMNRMSQQYIESSRYRKDTSGEENSDNEKWYNGVTKCFYTALIGKPGKEMNSDRLAECKRIDGWDYICFTNLDINYAHGWNIVRVEYDGEDYAREAKRYKWMSHSVLPDYDFTVWVDAYIAPNPLYKGIIEQWIEHMYLMNIAILHRAHTDRSCIWDECDAVVEKRRDTQENVSRVIELLKGESMPKNWGLFDTNIVIKNNKDIQLQEMCEKVYGQVCNISDRDQLAVPFIYYTNNYNGFQTMPLLRAFEKTGIHVQIPR